MTVSISERDRVVMLMARPEIYTRSRWVVSVPPSGFPSHKASRSTLLIMAAFRGQTTGYDQFSDEPVGWTPSR